jgi:serine/threonine-protein kinase
MPGVDCLSNDDLRAYLLGDLPDRLLRSMSRHLENCATCEAAVRQLDAQVDPFLRSLRRALGDAGDGTTRSLLDEGSSTDLSGPAAGDALAAGEASGQRISGYEILGELGRGGMGVVYQARQERPNRLVPLKMILAGRHAAATRRARFLAEADAIARLQHPRIVQIYEVGEHDGLPFLSLEYLPGGSLRRRLSGAPLPPETAAELVEKLARAVQHAHEHGVIHRDLKPANVLFTDAGEPKVTDFGLAKQERTDLTDTGAIVGTPSYMAPEQAVGEKGVVGPAADVYALGAILYECLTGRPPFRAPTALETLEQVRSQEPVPATQLQPRLPRDLNTICLKCLHKEPVQRYASAGELADDLARFLRGEAVRACPPSAWSQFARFARRHKGKLVIAGLVLFFLMVLGGGVGWVIRDQATRRGVLQQEVARALEDAQDLCRHERMAEARGAVKRAEALLAGGEGDVELHKALDLVRTDVMLADQLEAIRLGRSAVKAGHFDYAGADQEYQHAFQNYGLDVTKLEVDEAAERIQASAIRDQLVAALDDWLVARSAAGLPADAHLLAALRRADPDSWRNQLREASQRLNKQVLKNLAEGPKFLRQPPTTIVLLATVLTQVGERPLAIKALRSAQPQYPSDFWINQNLAFGLMQLEPPQVGEAVAYYRAALAIRPNSPGVYMNLGGALQANGDLPGALAAAKKAIALKKDYAEAYCVLGNVHDASKDRAGAIAAYRKAIAVKPDCAPAYYNLSNALRDQGDLPAAMAACKKAIALDPGLAEAHCNLGVLLQAGSDSAGAIAAYQKAIALKPGLAEAQFNLGRLLHSRGDLPGAIAAFRRAVALKFSAPELHCDLGAALAKQGDLTAAVAAYQQAIALKPDYSRAYYNLGIALHARNDLPGAIGAYQKAIALQPDSAAAHCNLGRALQAKDDLPGAIAAYEQAIALGPTAFESHFNLGVARQTQGDLVGAIAAFRKAIALKPDFADAYHYLGVALADRNEATEAIAAYQKAIALKPDYTAAYFNLGVSLRAKGDLPAATVAYQKAIALQPDFASAYFNLGNTLSARNDLPGAIAAYQKNIALVPGHAEAHCNLGQALQAKGDLPGAIAACEKAIALKPNLAEAHCNLGLALRQLGGFRKALEALRRGHELGSKTHNWRNPSAQWLRECERLVELDDQLPDFLARKKAPVSADEQIELADMCFLKRWHRAAARFYEEAFAAEPKLQLTHRYDAACAAALAGCSQGEDTAQLDERERERLRSLALKWLRGKLTQWTSELAENRARLDEVLRHCQRNPNLAGLREPDQLAKLSPQEREDWLRFWTDVRAALARSQGSTPKDNRRVTAP